MKNRVLLCVGTKKGLFVAESSKARGQFTLRGPFGTGVAVVVAAQHADAGTFGPTAVVLHVKPAGNVRVAGDLVNALAEFGVRIGRETGSDAFVGRGEGRATILA